MNGRIVIEAKKFLLQFFLPVAILLLIIFGAAAWIIHRNDEAAAKAKAEADARAKADQELVLAIWRDCNGERSIRAGWDGAKPTRQAECKEDLRWAKP